MDGVPSAYVGADVTGGVIDVEGQEVGVRTTSDEASGEVCSPAGTEIIQKNSGGMFGAAQQGEPGLKKELTGAGFTRIWVEV